MYILFGQYQQEDCWYWNICVWVSVLCSFLLPGTLLTVAAWLSNKQSLWEPAVVLMHTNAPECLLCPLLEVVLLGISE